MTPSTISFADGFTNATFVPESEVAGVVMSGWNAIAGEMLLVMMTSEVVVA